MKFLSKSFEYEVGGIARILRQFDSAGIVAVAMSVDIRGLLPDFNTDLSGSQFIDSGFAGGYLISVYY